MGPLGHPWEAQNVEMHLGDARTRIQVTLGVLQSQGRVGSNSIVGERWVSGEPTEVGQGSATWDSEPEEVVVQILTSNLQAFIFRFRLSSISDA